MYRNVYSEFEVKQMCIKFDGEGEQFEDMSCVGSSEEDLEVKVITKKCRGVVQREKIKGTGNGKLSLSLHVPYDIYNKIYAMNRANLVEGVKAYGQGSRHPEFALTQLVEDEDGEIKYKAYPRCTMETGPKRPVENGQEEVPELSMEVKLLPDDNGECMYEALAERLDDEIAEKWMKEFEPSLVQVKA